MERPFLCLTIYVVDKDGTVDEFVVTSSVVDPEYPKPVVVSRAMLVFMFISEKGISSTSVCEVLFNRMIRIQSAQHVQMYETLQTLDISIAVSDIV